MKKVLGGTIIGFLGALLLYLVLYKIIGKKEEKTQNDYYIITNQIQKMNKMVVLEQNFSSMQRTKISREFLGGTIPGTDKSIITYTKTNAQVTYDLNKMQIKIDSIGKKLIIESIPKPEIRIIPSVEIQSMDDSFIDRFTERDIKKITQTAKEKAYNSVNQNALIKQSQKQLKDNLEQIFVLARVLHYSIEDKTGEIDLTAS